MESPWECTERLRTRRRVRCVRRRRSLSGSAAEALRSVTCEGRLLDDPNLRPRFGLACAGARVTQSAKAHLKERARAPIRYPVARPREAKRGPFSRTHVVLGRVVARRLAHEARRLLQRRRAVLPLDGHRGEDLARVRAAWEAEGAACEEGQEGGAARQSCQSALWRCLDTSAGRLAPN